MILLKNCLSIAAHADYTEISNRGSLNNYDILILSWCFKKNFQPAQRDRALVLNYMKRPDEGLSYVLSSIKQNPQDYLAFNTLGLILISLIEENISLHLFSLTSG